MRSWGWSHHDDISILRWDPREYPCHISPSKKKKKSNILQRGQSHRTLPSCLDFQNHVVYMCVVYKPTMTWYFYAINLNNVFQKDTIHMMSTTKGDWNTDILPVMGSDWCLCRTHRGDGCECVMDGGRRCLPSPCSARNVPPRGFPPIQLKSPIPCSHRSPWNPPHLWGFSVSPFANSLFKAGRWTSFFFQM